MVSRKDRSTEDYFLAGKSLPWWAIGASLIAANISAEQFIGMSGSGFAIGLAIASYEWMAAITLLVVGKFFLPIFIKKGIYTIPEFVEKRFSTNLKTILAVFWIGLFVFVNLTSVMYLGARALDTIVGTGDGIFERGLVEHPDPDLPARLFGQPDLDRYLPQVRHPQMRGPAIAPCHRPPTVRSARSK